MFPGGKKRGCGSYENPEPSSPKVTCIGQVRVKTKKQGKKMRAVRSKSGRREVSFRKTEQSVSSGDAASNHHFHPFQQQEQRNQRWVHLPVTICEALRAFGAEFNCFLPCRSSCMANKDERGTTHNGVTNTSSGNSSGTSCGAVFARWLVAEKIELVVGDKVEEVEEDEEEDMRPRRSQRRHVFEDIVIEEAEKNDVLEEEKRVSICIPPKNALLLMRCRSDPVKMAALANRFFECPAPDVEDNEHDNGLIEEEGQHDPDKEMDQVSVKSDSLSQAIETEHSNENAEVEIEAELVDLDCEEVKLEEENQLVEDEKQDLEKEDREDDKGEESEVLEQTLEEEKQEEEAFESGSSLETSADAEKETIIENVAEITSNQVKEEALIEENEESEDKAEESGVAAEEKQTLEKMLLEEVESELEEETVATEAAAYGRSDPVDKSTDPETGQESNPMKSESNNVLPDCLLLMMCEPKLSMEVSKETWVCSTDFIRWHPPEKKQPRQPQPQLPQQTVIKTDGSDQQPKKRVSIDLPPLPPKHQNPIMQPPRSSCSFPAAPPFITAPAAQSINTMVEQKLVGSKYEPFVLTRCKSEPMRSSAKLAPEACFWKNRKLEPHPPAATLGVGAAGVGF